MASITSTPLPATTSMKHSLFNSTTSALLTTLISFISSTTPAPATTFMSSTNASTTNTTTNATDLPPPCASANQGDTETEKLLKIIGYCLILIVSLVGNTLIITIILRNKKMKRPTNYFILNMAASDLVVPTMIMTRKIAEVARLGTYGWAIGGDLGMVLCKVTNFLQDVSVAVSIISLILITSDRFFAVVFPMKHYIMSGFICKMAIAVSWLIGMSLHAIYLYTYDIIIHMDKRVICYNVWEKLSWSEQVIENYYLTMFFLLAVTPFVIMAVAYTIIYVSLRRQSLPLGDSFTDRQRRQRALRERKVLLMAVAIVISFALLWAPYNTASFLVFFVYTAKNRPCWYPTFVFVAFYCAYANSAVNPCICFAFSENFRQGFKDLFISAGILSGRPNVGQQATQISMTSQSRYNKAYDDQETKQNGS